MTPPALHEADAALAHGDWETARDRYQRALETEDDPHAWEGLSWAGWWLSDEALTFEARERAYRAYRDRDDCSGAARTAIWLASDYLDFRAETAPAAGWLERANSLIEDCEPCPEQGWILLLQADCTGASPAEYASRGRAAAELGGQLNVPDLEAVGLAYEGSGLIARGRVEEGIRRLDEGAAVAAGERFELALAPGWTLCTVITACDGVGDFKRASQWVGRLDSFSSDWGGRHFAGVCRTAYGKLLATNGDWPRAETELQAAVADLAATRPGLAARGYVRLGELRARQGLTDEARALFEQAGGHPVAAIGSARLDLDAGDATSARDCADRILRRLPPGNVIDRLPALELLVEAQVQLRDLEAAAAAYYELRDTAELMGTPYLVGRADLAGARLAAACDDHEDARRAAEDAVDRLAEAHAPYEVAQARVVLADALAALGRASAAGDELRAARSAFESLGAARDVPRTERASQPNNGGLVLSDLTTRELEVLRLVASGHSDAEIAERLVVSPHTVHRHVANVRTKLGLPSRAAAVAYAAREGLL